MSHSMSYTPQNHGTRNATRNTLLQIGPRGFVAGHLAVDLTQCEDFRVSGPGDEPLLGEQRDGCRKRRCCFVNGVLLADQATIQVLTLLKCLRHLEPITPPVSIGWIFGNQWSPKHGCANFDPR